MSSSIPKNAPATNGDLSAHRDASSCCPITIVVKAVLKQCCCCCFPSYPVTPIAVDPIDPVDAGLLKAFEEYGCVGLEKNVVLTPHLRSPQLNFKPMLLSTPGVQREMKETGFHTRLPNGGVLAGIVEDGHTASEIKDFFIKGIHTTRGEIKPTLAITLQSMDEKNNALICYIDPINNMLYTAALGSCHKAKLYRRESNDKILSIPVSCTHTSHNIGNLAPTINAEVSAIQMRDGDLLILASDGLWKRIKHVNYTLNVISKHWNDKAQIPMQSINMSNPRIRGIQRYGDNTTVMAIIPTKRPPSSTHG